MTNEQVEFLPILDGAVQIPTEYARDVGEIKRALEYWTMDPAFRSEFEQDPENALTTRKIHRSPQEITPFVCPAEARKLHAAEANGTDSDYPLSVRRYRHFLKEKLSARSRMRANIQVSNKDFDTWRKRQINRCIGELGYHKADGIVHSPVSFELTSGCSVGCWFCALSSKKLSDIWEYTEENASFWRDTLHIVKEVVGEGAKYGVCYWATEPFDNPDYEKFITDYTRILGRCPQTTTAASNRDISRLSRFLCLTQELGSDIDRFSILSLKMLRDIHEHFSAENLLKVELIPQNREASGQYRKAYAGRARGLSQDKPQFELVQPEQSPSTIACISGFIINMPLRTVTLITPCPSSTDWPLGHWVLDEGHFEDTAGLYRLLTGMIDTHMSSGLHIDDVISFRPDLAWESSAGETYSISSKFIRLNFSARIFTQRLLELLSQGPRSVYELASILERETGADLCDMFLVLNEYFQKGLLNEDPVYKRQHSPAEVVLP
jgi:radical SAM family RiPP maturation amino acid epimerase